MSVSSSATSTPSRSSWKLSPRFISFMESIYAIVAGLSLRFVIGTVTRHDFKITGTLVGLWEGVILLHFLKKLPKSTDPYLAFAVRLFIDFVVTESVSRLVLVLTWTGMGMILADVAPPIWEEIGLRRVWRRLRRDMYIISESIPTVVFFPPTRTVRFSPSREPSVIEEGEEEQEPDANVPAESQSVVSSSSAEQPVPTNIVIKRRLPGYFPGALSDTESIFSSVVERGPRLPSTFQRDSERTSRRLSMYPITPADDSASDISSQQNEAEDDIKMSSSSSSVSTVTGDAGDTTRFTDDIRDFDTTQITDIPDEELLEEQVPIEVMKGTEEVIKRDGAPGGERTPTQLNVPILLPPTPSDSQAPRKRRLPGGDIPMLSAAIPQIPDLPEDVSPEGPSEEWENIGKEEANDTEVNWEKVNREDAFDNEKPLPQPPEEGRDVEPLPVTTSTNTDDHARPDEIINTDEQRYSKPPPPYVDFMDDDDIYEDHPSNLGATAGGSSARGVASIADQKHEEREKQLELEAEKKRQEEAQKEKERLEEEEKERKKREAEAAAEKRRLQEEAEKKRKEVEAEAEAAAAAQRWLEEEAENKRKEEEAEKRRKEQEEAERKRKEEQEAAAAEQRRLQEAENKRKEEAEAEIRRLREQAENKRKEEQEAAAAEQRRLQEAENKRKEEAEAEIRTLQEAAEKKRKEEQEAAAAEQRRLQEAENKRKEQEAEAAAAEIRRLQEEAEKKLKEEQEAAAAEQRRFQEAENKRKEAEEAEKRRLDLEAENLKEEGLTAEKSEEEEKIEKEVGDEGQEDVKNQTLAPEGTSAEETEEKFLADETGERGPKTSGAVELGEHPEHHADNTGPDDDEDHLMETSSFITEQSAIALDVEDRLRRILLTKAQIVDLQSRIVELEKSDGGTELEHALKVLEKMKKKEKRRRDQVSRTVEPNPKDTNSYISFETLSLADTKTRLMEMLEELLLPDMTSLQLSVYCANKKSGGSAQKSAVTKLLEDFNLLNYAADIKGRETRIHVPEEHFSEWITGYRTSITRADDDHDDNHGDT